MNTDLHVRRRRQQALTPREGLIAVAGVVQQREILGHGVALIGYLLRFAPQRRLDLALQHSRPSRTPLRNSFYSTRKHLVSHSLR
jgi:hypothetical protein